MNQPVRSEPARRRPPVDRAPRHLEAVPRPPARRPGPAWAVPAVSGAGRGRLVLAGLATAAVVVAFALVYLHVNMAQRQFQLDRLSTQLTKEQTTYSRLRLQAAQLESPQQIIATAEGKLGMRQPANVTYLSPTLPMPTGAGSGGGLQGRPGPSGGAPAQAGTVPAPAGEADWPRIKSQLAGSP